MIALYLCFALAACAPTASKERAPEKARFKDGQLQARYQQKQTAEGIEATVVARFELARPLDDPDLSTYFQYRLGEHIRLVAGTDTLAPALHYYVPLLSEMQKEIDCAFVLTPGQNARKKRLIIQDSLLEFDKVNLSLQ
ncbi:MAG: hypothetical protein EOO16_08485 [Chitinophagaceae bacterium]|nr:MAG: hypothetical protein EOO16_08485 [Chitinophagaceae bacterium]